MTIASFVEFFTDGYSLVCLVIGASVLGCVLGISLCVSAQGGNWAPIISILEVFFDVTSAAANWKLAKPANLAHAFGSLWHGLGASFRLAGDYTGGLHGGRSQLVGRARTHPVSASCSALFFSLPGEIIELSAIVSTLDAWRQITCIIIVVAGTIVTFCVAFVWHEEKREPEDKDKDLLRKPLKVGYGMQATYLIIVVIAATEDSSRLLWMLPEIPVETITLALAVCGAD